MGRHCETVATGTLLGAVGIDLSEPMLFGLGEALGFVFLNLSSLPLPFVGGRTRPFEPTEALCRNLGLALVSRETSSKAKAWTRLEEDLAAGPVGLQLDCFHLPYFERPPHFAGHFVAALRTVGEAVEVVDTVQQGSVRRVSRPALEAARHERGPMAAKARSYTIGAGEGVPLAVAARTAMRENARSYLAPAFGGAGVRGIDKLRRSLPGWLEQASAPEALRLAADLMERAGTGGALFRNLYRDFLTEAAALVPEARVVEARDHFAGSAALWTAMAALLERCAEDGRAGHLVEAAGLCRGIGEHEVAGMEALAGL